MTAVIVSRPAPAPPVRSRVQGGENPVRAARVLWAGGEDCPVGILLAWGAAVWLAVSAAFVVVNGVVLDETVTAAQIITGDVVYPAGHPHEVFYTKAFSLPHYAAALAWKVVPNPAMVSAVRNVLFLFATTFTAFAVAVVLTRMPLAGHFAAVLTLSEGLMSYSGNYPVTVFPQWYSHGHFGVHAAILAVVLMAGRCWLTGGLLVGLLPGIHPGLAVVTWPFVVAWWLVGREPGNRREATRFGTGVAVGVLACAAVAVAILVRTAGAEVTAPYNVTGDSGLLSGNFTRMTDLHNRPFAAGSFAYLVGPAVFAAVSLLWLSTGQSHREALTLIALGGLCWAVVYGAWLYHSVFGELPYVLNVVRPYRLSNLAGTLLLPMAAAVIGLALQGASARVKPFLFAVIVGLVAIQARETVSDKSRLFNHMVLVVVGVTAAFACQAIGTLRRAVVGFAVFLVTAALIATSTEASGKQVAIFLGSFAAATACLWIGAVHPALAGSAARHTAWLSAATAVVCIVTVSLTAAFPRMTDTWQSVHYDARAGRWDVVNDDDHRLKTWLAGNAQPGEMLATFLMPRSEWQAKVGHPVLIELETLWLMTYMPNLSPAIAMICRDLYGIDYAAGGPDTDIRAIQRPDHVSAVWRNRTREQWSALRQKYGVRLVLGPSRLAVDLPSQLTGGLWTLYAIP